MEKFVLRPIGKVFADDSGFGVRLEPEFRQALTGLEDFTWINVLWWFSASDNTNARAKRIERSPYKNAPETLGTFATRSPERPNPIALTSAQITYIDKENGIIGVTYIDADDGSPVVDIKPYLPCLDRVSDAGLPEWCAHWPDCVEKSADFDWESVFNF